MTTHSRIGNKHSMQLARYPTDVRNSIGKENIAKMKINGGHIEFRATHIEYSGKLQRTMHFKMQRALGKRID